MNLAVCAPSIGSTGDSAGRRFESHEGTLISRLKEADKMFRRARSLGAATLLLLAAVFAPNLAIAADPLLPTSAAGVYINTSNNNDRPSYVVTGGDPDPGFSGFSSIPQFQFELVKAPTGPGESLTRVTLQRTRGQYDQPFKLTMGASLYQVRIQLRKAAADGKADWFSATLENPKVVVDEERSSKGSTTSTEVVVLSFSKVTVWHRVQTAQGYTPYAEVPPQFDIKNIVQLIPPPPPVTPPSGGAMRR